MTWEVQLITPSGQPYAVLDRIRVKATSWYQARVRAVREGMPDWPTDPLHRDLLAFMVRR